jgi:hypothetical protein
MLVKPCLPISSDCLVFRNVNVTEPNVFVRLEQPLKVSPAFHARPKRYFVEFIVRYTNDGPTLES